MSDQTSLPIAGHVKQIVANEKKYGGQPEQLKKFKEALTMLDDLVQRGLTQRKGFNLMTPDSEHYDRAILSVNHSSVTHRSILNS